MAVNVIQNFVDESYASVIIDGSEALLQKIEDRPGYFEDIYPKIAKSFIDTTSDLDPRVSSDEEKLASAYISHALYLTKIKLESFYQKKLENYEGGLVKLISGAHNGLHSDMYMLDGSEWNDGTGREAEKEYSALLYFSTHNQDFFGGEIVFPQHKKIIKPRCGDLVFFRGDLDHLHEVKPIEGGERYALIMFFGE